MNILDTVLYTADAQEYSKNFKQFSIDASTLKVLNDEDLKILGIEENEKRIAILQHAANLQIPADKYANIAIDEKYVSTVLAQMYIHLTKHLATLSIAVNRNDVIVCNVRLTPAVKYLKNCIQSLGEQLTEFDEKIIARRNNRRKTYKRIVIAFLPTVAIGSVAFFLFQIFKHT